MLFWCRSQRGFNLGRGKCHLWGMVVLTSMFIHMLSAVNPPECIINQMHKMFAKFFGVTT